MNTRSKTRELQTIYTVDIDFDEASEAWRANKKKLSNGCYAYTCCKQLKNGSMCRQIPRDGDYCSRHQLSVR